MLANAKRLFDDLKITIEQTLGSEDIATLNVKSKIGLYEVMIDSSELVYAGNAQ